jgi:hypothetical protein
MQNYANKNANPLKQKSVKYGNAPNLFAAHLRRIEVSSVDEYQCHEVSNHQTETQVLANRISFAVFEPKKSIFDSGTSRMRQYRT